MTVMPTNTPILKAMLSWHNVREGDELLRVSESGRFVIRREVRTRPSGTLFFRYEVSDLWRENREETVDTLQAARRQAEAWASDP